MTGIYKITSPSGKVYIGRSVNILKRFDEYKRMSRKCEGQTRLWRSLNKYGVSEHIFETIEICERSQLNTRERYWQEVFEVLGENGLNCVVNKLEGLDAGISEETRIKMSLATSGVNNPMYGVKRSSVWREEQSLRFKGKRAGKNNPMYGKIGAMNGRKHTEEALEKMRKFQSTQEHPHARIVVDLTTGIFFNSVREAAEVYGLNRYTLAQHLSGLLRNKTNLIIC